jgi:hypothetical protein
MGGIKGKGGVVRGVRGRVLLLLLLLLRRGVMMGLVYEALAVGFGSDGGLGLGRFDIWFWDVRALVLRGWIESGL